MNKLIIIRHGEYDPITSKLTLAAVVKMGSLGLKIRSLATTKLGNLAPNRLKLSGRMLVIAPPILSARYSAEMFVSGITSLFYELEVTHDILWSDESTPADPQAGIQLMASRSEENWIDNVILITSIDYIENLLRYLSQQFTWIPAENHINFAEDGVMFIDFEEETTGEVL